MNRIIKFRGKHSLTNEWIFGNYEHYNNGVPHIFGIDYAEPVKEDTIGQYTGLRDRNGKEVYEGDIVFWIAPDLKGRGKGMQGAIIWDAPTMSWAILNDKPTSDGRPMIISRPFDKKHLEIVGNIFDNPELMERANGNKRTN